MDTTKSKKKIWFRLDCYRPRKKGVKAQSWYPTKNQALKAKQAINTFPYAWRAIDFQAGNVIITKSKKCGGLIAKGPFQDNSVNF